MGNRYRDGLLFLESFRIIRVGKYCEKAGLTCAVYRACCASVINGFVLMHSAARVWYHGSRFIFPRLPTSCSR